MSSFGGWSVRLTCNQVYIVATCVSCDNEIVTNKMEIKVPKLLSLIAVAFKQGYKDIKRDLSQILGIQGCMDVLVARKSLGALNPSGIKGLCKLKIQNPTSQIQNPTSDKGFIPNLSTQAAKTAAMCNLLIVR